MDRKPSHMPPSSLSPDEAERLNDRILACHENKDLVSLAAHYRAAGLDAETREDQGEASFFFTQAYVYALKTGQFELADALWCRLRALGREM